MKTIQPEWADTTRRYQRTMHAAFQQHEAWRGVIERHRAPLLMRLWRVVVRVTAVAAIFGGLGALLAWGGRSM